MCKIYSKIYIVCIFFVCSCYISNAIPTNTFTLDFTSENSTLTSNTVYRIVCDDYGYIWLATENGLLCYDGNTFKKMTIGIKDDEIIYFYKEKDHLYLFNYSGQVAKLNLKTQKIEDASLLSKWLQANQSYLVYNVVNINDTIYFLDEFLGGFSKNINGENYCIVLYTEMWKRIITTCKVPKNFPAISDIDSVIHKGKGTNIKFKNNCIIIFNKIYAIKDKRVSVLFDGNWNNINNNVSDFEIIGNDLYISFYEKMGLIKVSNYLSDGNKPYHIATLLHNKKIESLTKDLNNNLFAAIIYEGIKIIPTNIHHIWQYTVENTQLHSNSIKFMKYKGNELFIAYSDGHIETMSKENVFPFPLTVQIPVYDYKNIIFNDEGMLVVVNNGIVNYKAHAPTSIVFQNIKDIVQGYDIILSSNRNKLEIFDAKTNKFKRIDIKLPSYITADVINDTLYAIGTLNGLYFNNDLIDGTATERFNKVRKIGDVIVGLGRKSVFIIKDKKIVKKLTTANGLIGENYIDIQYDNKQYYYILSDKGINIIDKNTLEVKRMLEGKKLIEPVKINCFALSGDTLMLGTNNGIWKVSPQYFEDLSKVQKPTVYFNAYADNHLIEKSVDANDISIQYGNFKNLRLGVDEVGYNPLGYNVSYAVHYESKTIDSSELARSTINLGKPKPGIYHIVIYSQSDYINAPILTHTFTVSVMPLWYQQVVFQILLLILFAIALLFLVRYIYKRQVRKNLSNFQKKEHLLALEHKSLFGQLKSHFIFNALNPLQGFILHKETDSALEYLEKFSKLIRGLLNQSRDKQTTVKQELDFVNNFIKVSQSRVAKMFEYNLKLPNREALEYIIPTMMLQPIVENAIEHGIRNNHKKTGYLEIEIRTEENQLHIITRDNGTGFDMNNSKKHNHALTIIEERIELLKSEFGVGELLIKNDNNLNAVILILPVKK